jgi:hypothetical protein
VPAHPDAGGRAPGDILSPTHDAFLGTAANGFPVFAGKALIRTGKDGRPWLRVQVLVGGEHQEKFVVGAHDVIVWVKTEIGKHDGAPFRARSPHPDAPTLGPAIACFSGTNLRGLANVWVPLSGVTDPGFQLHAEVVDWDPWFQFGSNQWDWRLANGGPQYLAASDQVMVHVGQEPLSDDPHRPGATRVIAPAAGVFVNRSLIVEEDGNSTNDAEQLLLNFGRLTIAQLIESIRGKDLLAEEVWREAFPKGGFFEYVGGDLGKGLAFTINRKNPPEEKQIVDGWTGLVVAMHVDGAFTARVNNVRMGTLDLDLSWQEIPELRAWEELFKNWKLGDPVPEPVPQTDGDSGLRLDADLSKTWLDLTLKAPWNAVACPGSLAVRAKATVTGWGEVDNQRPSGLTTRGAGGITEGKLLGIAMPVYQWLRPGCVLLYGLVSAATPTFLSSQTARQLGSLLLGSFGDRKPSLVQGLVDGADLLGILNGLRLTGKPDPNRPGATQFGNAKVSVAGLRDSCDPARCDRDDSILTEKGIELLVDAGLAEESPGGRWPNVYQPQVTRRLDHVIRSHADLLGRRRDLGVAVDGRFVNLALATLTRLGHLDFGAGQHGPVGATIAPMYLSRIGTLQRPIRLVVPDVHVEALGNRWAISLLVNVGGKLDGATGSLQPDVEVIPEVEFLYCAADYSNWYGTSYNLCGHTGNELIISAQTVRDIADLAARIISQEILSKLRVPVPSMLTDVVGTRLNLGVADGAIQTAGGNLLLTALRGPAPPTAYQVRLDDAATPTFTFRATPSGFPGQGPYEVTWSVTDAVSGNAVDTTACTNQLTCFLDETLFDGVSDPMSLGLRRSALVDVTVRRGGVAASDSRLYHSVP